MNTPHRILVIEDDAAIRAGLVDALGVEGFGVFQAGDAKVATELALTTDCHLVLLDLLLPGGDGLTVLGAIRAARPTLPVIILTARGDESDRVKGLARGADDYVVKPFSIRELIARVRAVLRRSPARPIDVACIRFANAGLEADLLRRELRSSDGHREELSEKEVDLLRYLASNPGRAISRDELLRNVWQVEPRGLSTRTIDMHVARLREKLRDPADDPRLLLTVRAMGYMLGPDATASATPEVHQ